MPKYLLIERSFFKASNELHSRNHEPGDTIEFAGVPGAVMLPLDQAAADAKAARKADMGRTSHSQHITEIQGRARLSGSKRKMLAEAEAGIKRS